jgi:hypothetical protein
VFRGPFSFLGASTCPTLSADAAINAIWFVPTARFVGQGERERGREREREMPFRQAVTLRGLFGHGFSLRVK